MVAAEASAVEEMARLRVAVRDNREKAAALLENMIVDRRKRKMLVKWRVVGEVEGAENLVGVALFIGFLTTYDYRCKLRNSTNARSFDVRGFSIL